MSEIPSGTELARPFMPARDFDLSKRFYEALGFTKVLDSEVRFSTLAPAASSCSATTKKIGSRTS